MTGAIDDNERTNALGLFNTARSYWHSAEHLNAANLEVTHPQAPVTFLFCHAIELYLKAFLRGAGKSIAELKQIGHRVANLAKAADSAGLKIEPEQSEVLSHIDDASVAIEARYIVTGFKNLPTNDALSGAASYLDQAICTALAKGGLPVRSETFERPKPRQDGVLEADTNRVLVHLFTASEMDDRDVGTMAAILRLDKGMLEYRLDLLDDAKLAENTGFNYVSGHVYWAITPQGRRHVVRHDLLGAR
jgi:hypothetical protein